MELTLEFTMYDSLSHHYRYHHIDIILSLIIDVYIFQQ